MRDITRITTHQTGRDLQQMVEPLANYICATEEPTLFLVLALAAIVHEVETTNRAALVHSHAFSEN